MHIRLDRIEEEPFRWDQPEEPPSALLERPEVLSIQGLHWSGIVESKPPGFRLQAAIEYDQKLACSRCLNPLEEKVATEIELYLLVKAPLPMGGEVELEGSDLGVLHLESDTLETDPLLHEQLELNVPMSVLCRSDCAGLCPHCGADRNEEPDCCGGQSIDPRWQVLKDLKTN